jgi:hypothetical protein
MAIALSELLWFQESVSQINEQAEGDGGSERVIEDHRGRP